jgi:hypothetical protein
MTYDLTFTQRIYAMKFSQTVSHVKMELVCNIYKTESGSKTLDTKSSFTWLTAKEDFINYDKNDTKKKLNFHLVNFADDQTRSVDHVSNVKHPVVLKLYYKYLPMKESSLESILAWLSWHSLTTMKNWYVAEYEFLIAWGWVCVELWGGNTVPFQGHPGMLLP